MQPLDRLTHEARVLAEGGAMTREETELARVMGICNACRYCEGFCAVFPAMTRRLAFGRADVHFLASLCHNCGACLHACQYAPPHEFAVQVPRAMAQVRLQTYQDHAWPAFLGGLYRRHGLALTLGLALAMSGVFGLGILARGGAQVAEARHFYDLFSHQFLVAVFLPVFLFACVALAVGVVRFWRQTAAVTGARAPGTAACLEATGDVLSLRNLGGGHGEGCHEEDDGYTLVRRRLHHLTFYGFALCFAATTVASFQHYALGWVAPYDLPSAPKWLGLAGGLSLCVGTLGLWRLNLRRHPGLVDPAQRPMDLGLIALLFLAASSGLSLWAARGTVAQAWLLCLHLGVVMALFLTMPYGKFVHGFYRAAALLRDAVHKRLPGSTGLPEG